MESNNSQSNEGHQNEEFTLFFKNENPSQNTNEEQKEELITDEEYMLECARFGDLEDLINLIKEVPDLDINYKDNKLNTALRKKLIKK
jgi:hypothetical protein